MRAYTYNYLTIKAGNAAEILHLVRSEIEGIARCTALCYDKESGEHWIEFETPSGPPINIITKLSSIAPEAVFTLKFTQKPNDLTYTKSADFRAGQLLEIAENEPEGEHVTDYQSQAEHETTKAGKISNETPDLPF